jgi:hypothetical protein
MRNANQWHSTAVLAKALVTTGTAFASIFCAALVCNAELYSKPLLPQPIWMGRIGLDIQNNKIDALLNTFGFVCLHTYLSPKHCRFEIELIRFLRAHNAADIRNEIEAFGAVCEDHDQILACRYDRHVVQTNWKADLEGPLSVTDEYFTVKLSIDRSVTPSQFEAFLTRTTEPRNSPK